MVLGGIDIAVVGIVPVEVVASPTVKVSEKEAESAIAVFVATWESLRIVVGELLSGWVDEALELSMLPIWVFKRRGEVPRMGASGVCGVGGFAMPCPVVCNKPTS